MVANMVEWWSASIIGRQRQIQSEISGSAILITNKCIRHRNIAFLQACQLQIWQLSIANENMCYSIIALENELECSSTHIRCPKRN
jgi:hypothetical protein